MVDTNSKIQFYLDPDTAFLPLNYDIRILYNTIDFSYANRILYARVLVRKHLHGDEYTEWEPVYEGNIAEMHFVLDILGPFYLHVDYYLEGDEIVRTYIGSFFGIEPVLSNYSPNFMALIIGQCPTYINPRAKISFIADCMMYFVNKLMNPQFIEDGEKVKSVYNIIDSFLMTDIRNIERIKAAIYETVSSATARIIFILAFLIRDGYRYSISIRDYTLDPTIGIADCQKYCDVYMKILINLGFDCRIVTYSIRDNVHALVEVCVDDERYLVDLVFGFILDKSFNAIRDGGLPHICDISDGSGYVYNFIEDFTNCNYSIVEVEPCNDYWRS